MPFKKHEGLPRKLKVRGQKYFQKEGGRPINGGLSEYEDASVCPLCASASKEQLQLVEEAFLTGVPANEISEQRNLSVRDVSQHLHRCLMTRHKSRYARVARAFDMLWEALDVAHGVFMKDPSMYHGTSYQGLLKQLRALMVDLDNVQNSEELAADLTQYALNPMIQALTNAVISESGSLKEDLTAKFDEQEAERLVADYVRRLTQHFSSASRTAHDRILETLTAKDQNRTRAAGGPGRPRKPGKHGNLKAVS